MIEYICEIAYVYWQNTSKWFYSKELKENFDESWLDYEHMVNFYEMILKEAESVEQWPMYCWLLNEIYTILDDAKAIERIHNDFLLSFKQHYE